MRALVFDSNLQFAENYPRPIPGTDESLLQIRRAGICNTDLEIIKGYMGFSGILGHEFVGEVIEGPAELIGKRVVGEINVADGECEFCRRGIPSQCSNRTTVGIDRHPGAFADYLALNTRNLHVVPDLVSDDSAVFAEPLAAALQVLEAVHISPRHRVVVIGAGKLGLLVAQVLRLIGTDLLVIVRRDKQAQMLNRWGISASNRSDVPNRSADVVIDCTGTAEGFVDALDIIKPRGILVLKSTYAELPHANLTRVVVDEIQVIGSRCGPFETALRLLASRLVDVESLIEARYPLAEGIQAMKQAAQPGTLKVLLEFQN